MIPLIKLKVKINGEKYVEGIYDSGSNVTLVNAKVLDTIKTQLFKHKSLLRTISGVDFTQSRAKLHLTINKMQEEMNVVVIKKDNFSYDLILGLDAIEKFKLIQDEELKIYQRVSDDSIEQISYPKRSLNVSERKTNFGEHIDAKKIIEDLEGLKEFEIKMFHTLFKKYEDVFAKDKYDVGTVKNFTAQIKMTEDRYVSKKPYRCSLPDQKEIETQVAMLLKKKLIEESSSPFASPVTLAFKKDENRRSRMCIDFRELNKLIVPEPQPFPRIEDILVKAGNCEWFSTLDINSAFWSIPIAKEDRHKTAFVTQNGHYQWMCMPFGLKISPAIFQRALSSIIRRHDLSKFCMNYIDDILIFSKSLQEHLRHIELLMIAMRNEGFKLKLSKCHFAKSSVKYLGHIISRNIVRPSNDNLKAIKEFERPKNKKNVRQLLGKINFYHKYVENSTKRLEPLHNLLRKNVEFLWTEECERSFVEIKKLLCSSPILSIYDQDKPVYVYTDASGGGLGAVLKQPQEDGMLHPVAYFSKRINPAQLKRKAIYLECLAIKEALVYWQHWLIGRTFTVVTDHKPLETMRVKARTDEVLGDLMFYISQYTFKIVYSQGKDNLEADALSRNPVLEIFENTDEVLKIVNLVTLNEIIEDQKGNQMEINKDKSVSTRENVCFKNIRNRERIWISQEFGKDIIKRVHKFFGHIGIDHMCRKIRPSYYFRNMDKLIEDFYSRCRVCMKNKTRTSRPIGNLSKLGPASQPYEIMSVDTVGGFVGYKSTKRFMNILVDHFTRKAFISTTTSQTAKELVKLIDRVTCEKHVKMILVDQYAAMKSAEFVDYLSSRGISLIYTATDHPQSNGLNERLNQTLVNRIRCKINDNDRRAWSVIADECVKEYNSTDHSVTKFSPNYLMDGQDSLIVPPQLHQKGDLEKDRAQARLNSEEDFKRNKDRVDRCRRSGAFKVDDHVYVKAGNKLNRKKLDEVRDGPFRIVKRKSNCMYEIDLEKKNRKRAIFHSNQLTPAYPPVRN